MLDQHLFSFVGVGSPDEAVAEATEKANAFLKTHTWQTTEGRSAYAFQAELYAHQGTWTYVIHLIGPSQETPQ